MTLALSGSDSGILDRADAAQPRCPRCDYVLANIPEERCPECGLGYSLLAVERVDQFVGTDLVRQYQAALRWSVVGLIVGGMPLVLPRLNSTVFFYIAAAALIAPTLVAVVLSLRALRHEWAAPGWAWVSPLMGGVFVLALVFQELLVLAGL